MERVGLVALSIAVATVVLVGASYGAELLQPYLEYMSERWSLIAPLIGFFTLFPAAMLVMRRKRVPK